MAHSYTPTYYSSLHDSITSICKNILPFSLKKRRLPAVEHRISKLQSDNLKWQQDSFHQILRLMGLHREGILAESEVSDFKSHLLQTLIASPVERDHPVILKDKLAFLQELLYAKCITENEYQSSKSSLLQQLAVQGAEMNTKDTNPKENPEEEWSVIDLKDENSKENSNSNNKTNRTSALKQIKGSVLGFVTSHKHGKNRAGRRRSIFEIEAEKSKSSSLENQRDDFYENPCLEKGNESETRSILMQNSVSNQNCRSVESKRKPFRDLFIREEQGSELENQRDGFYENPFVEKGKESETRSILMQNSVSNRNCRSVESKRKPFRDLFNREEQGSGFYEIPCLEKGILMQNSVSDRNCRSVESKRKAFRDLFKRDDDEQGSEFREKGLKLGKREWGWRRNNDSEDEISPLRFNEKSDCETYMNSSYKLVDSPVGEGPDTKQIKKKLLRNGTPSNFFIDKVLGDNIKKELLRIQSELSTTNPNLKFSNDQIEEISTKLPVDKADLNSYFPKSWCDRYGDVVLDVVKKEFKEHIGEMENWRAAAKERRGGGGYPTQWTKFEDDENSNPNLFGRENNSNQNPFGQGNSSSSSRQEKMSSWNQNESFKNPFWDQTI